MGSVASSGAKTWRDEKQVLGGRAWALLGDMPHPREPRAGWGVREEAVLDRPRRGFWGRRNLRKGAGGAGWAFEASVLPWDLEWWVGYTTHALEQLVSLVQSWSQFTHQMLLSGPSHITFSQMKQNKA